MAINTIIPAFGSDRAVASKIATHLADCEWVGIPFAMGCGIVQHLKARTINANDIHRHAMNLCRTVADEDMGPALREVLRNNPSHPDALADAQRFCRDVEANPDRPLNQYIQIGWAASYFMSAWVGRNGEAGKAKEFDATQSVRWNASGGDSVRRFRHAIDALEHWHQQLVGRVTFTTLDFREFLEKCKDQQRHGIYADPPWPDLGQHYKHGFSEQDHRDLAALLREYRRCRVVVRTNDHPLNHELYPESDGWTWHRNPSRNSGNNTVAEVLIVRN